MFHQNTKSQQKIKIKKYLLLRRRRRLGIFYFGACAGWVFFLYLFFAKGGT